MTPALGDVKPFENGVKVWVNPYEGGDWFITFQFEHIFTFLFFSLTGRMSVIKEVNDKFYHGYDGFYFDGDSLINLINYNWLSNRFTN